MSNTISPNLLNDTLRLVQLARETALVQGKQAQAERLTPVVKDLQNVVSTTRDAQTGKSLTAKPTQPTGTVKNTAGGATPTGVFAQSDFRTLLEAARKTPEPQASSRSLNSTERNHMVTAMSAGNMSEVDIARQMGMTRDEVRMILSVGRKSYPTGEVSG